MIYDVSAYPVLGFIGECGDMNDKTTQHVQIVTKMSGFGLRSKKMSRTPFAIVRVRNDCSYMMQGHLNSIHTL